MAESKKQKIIKLIKVVQNFPIIYDISYKCGNYAKEEKEAWAKIDSIMEWNECKSRWISLMRNYFRGQLNDEYMKLLSYLEPSSYKENNDSALSNTGTTSTNVAKKSISDTSEEINVNFVVSQRSAEPDGTNEVHLSTYSENLNCPTLSMIRKRKPEILDQEDIVPRKRDKPDNVETQSFLNFLKYINFTTRNFPPLVLNKLKIRIFEAVCKAETEFLKLKEN